MGLDLPISLHLPAETPLAFCLEISTDAGFFHFSFLSFPSFPQTSPWKPCHLQGQPIPPWSGSGDPAGEQRGPTCTLPPPHGMHPSPTNPWGAPGGLGHGTSQRVKLLPKHRKPAAKARFPGRKHAVYCGRKGKRSVNAIARAEVIGVSCCKLPE